MNQLFVGLVLLFVGLPKPFSNDCIGGAKGEFNHSLIHLRSGHHRRLYLLPFRSCAYQDHPMANRLTYDIYVTGYAAALSEKNYPTSTKVLTSSICFTIQSHLESVFCVARHVS